MSRWTPGDTAVWRALRAEVRREEPCCWRCGGEWDPDAPARTWWSFSVDHVLPASTHPHLALVRDNLRAAHYGCNSARGAAEAAAVPSSKPMTPSAVW